MSDFQRVWDECWRRVSRGDTTIQECLERYPEHADELRRLFDAAMHLGQGRNVQPSAAFKSRARAQLAAHMRAHPRAARSAPQTPWNGLLLRFALALPLVMAAFLASGTMLAQAALPGETLYNWKIGSETVWRMVYPDQLTANLTLLERRTQELTTVAGTPVAERAASENYVQLLSDLPRHVDSSKQEMVVQELTRQKAQLRQAGVDVPALDEVLRAVPAPAPTTTPTETPTVTPSSSPTAPSSDGTPSPTRPRRRTTTPTIEPTRPAAEETPATPLAPTAPSDIDQTPSPTESRRPTRSATAEPTVPAESPTVMPPMTSTLEITPTSPTPLITPTPTATPTPTPTPTPTALPDPL